MRIAFADLLFSWPPNGGADADLYHVASGLQQRGQEVHLFAAHEEGSTERGRIDPKTLPFPATQLEFTRRSLRPAPLGQAFREAIDAWRPDVVCVTHGYALKPYLIQALAHHRLVARYYAHEVPCARDARRYRDGAPCPNDYLRTPDTCRSCALDYLADGIRRGSYLSWTTDYLAAKAYTAPYHALCCEAIRTPDAIVVSNESLRAQLDGWNDAVIVIPGGVSLDAFPTSVEDEEDTPKVVLMTGRADDPLKGLDVLLEAGQRLAAERNDFEIWATHYDHTLSRENFRSLGWLSFEETLALYPRAAVCVAPSVWEEPFGLIAVEAMAAGRPVCASAVGGLQEIVRHRETGFLFESGDAPELAKQLDLLLDNADMRRLMGAAGRRRVEARYTWDAIIERHYLPLFETVAGGKNPDVAKEILD